MPWCPKCRTEYRDGFSECSDCKCELVDALEENKQEVEEYYTETLLISAKDEFEANIIQAKLNQSGIPVLKKHKETGGYLSLYMGMTPFGVDIYVPSKQLGLAKEIIKDGESVIMSNEQKPLEDIQEDSNTEELENNFNKKRRLGAWIIFLIFIPGLIWFVIDVIQSIIQMLNS